MSSLALIVIAYWVITYYGLIILGAIFEVLALVLPSVIESLANLFQNVIGRLLSMLAIVLKALMRAALWVVIRFAEVAKLALIFGYFWIEEAIRGQSTNDQNETFWEDGDESYAEEESQAARQAAYEQAVQVLGLPPVFTQAEMIKAYRHAIRAAHPDAGGSTKAAQAVNAARKTILAYRGWA